MEGNPASKHAAGPSDRAFGLTMAVALALLSAHAFWRERATVAPAALGLALVFLALALAVPRALRPLNVAWMAFGRVLERVFQPLMLLAVYALVLLPIALIQRGLLRGDSLRLRSRGARSFWIPRDPSAADRGTFRDQF